MWVIKHDKSDTYLNLDTNDLTESVRNASIFSSYSEAIVFYYSYFNQDIGYHFYYNENYSIVQQIWNKKYDGLQGDAYVR
jgi:hypothetical protein